MENISISKKQSVDEEIKRKNEQLLQEIEKASSNNSKFIKFQDKEHKILRILPDQTESINVTYPSKPDEKVQRFRFMVFEQTKKQIEKDGGYSTTEEQLSDATDEPKEWTVSITVAKELIKWINKGYFVLDVTREGVALNTSYDIAPYVD